MTGGEPTQPHRKPSHRTTGLLLILLLGAVLLPIDGITPGARAATPELLIGRPQAGEYQPVRGSNYLAWQQNSRSNPDRYDVYARSLSGGGRFIVNHGRSSAALGDIEGDQLVYQEFGDEDSDIWFFDLVARHRSPPPNGVNTSQWEYWPSMSQRWLLFGRRARSGTRTLILFDLSSNTSQRLDRVRGPSSFIAPGEVSGDYVVWHTCRSDTRCDVYLHHIPDDQTTRIANPDGRNQHSPSVTPDGTVYFARTRGDCGSGVQLMQQPLEGSAEALWRLPSGDDIATTNVWVDERGVVTVLYDHFACGRPAESDAWAITEDFSPQLTVSLDGDGRGTVTSSPPGINCGADCTESYETGIGVTLTATPADESAFVAWSGACTGVTPTCTLTMNGPRSVTATFTDRPVLIVAKAGTGEGTVTSSPGGINCGSDCSEPYDAGTSVVLTALADDGSMFVGWSGDCGGSTCTLTMNDSRSVTATFTEQPLLTVTNTGTGDGTVTSSPGGINCGSDCSEPYDAGTSVVLTATPAAGSTFEGWSGDCGGSACTVSMNSAHSVTATFTDQPVLTVSKEGSGEGTVTSSPGGIDCGSDCDEPYDPGTVVTLTALADDGSTFVHWSGDCHGNSCAVTMDSSHSVTAVFDTIEGARPLGGPPP